MKGTGKNVYILGAGFSAFAGAPLVKDFLDRMRDTTETSDLIHPAGREAQNLVLEKRAVLSQVREKVRIDLDDIEELFSLIDAVAPTLPETGFDDLQRAIRKAISATILASTAKTNDWLCNVAPGMQKEIARIIPNAAPHEASNTGLLTNPYVLFAALIAHRLESPSNAQNVSDAVISFNYDMVLEDALEQLGVSPDYALRDAVYEEGRKSAEQSVKLLKLHGSINWALEQEDKSKVRVVAAPESLIENKEGFPYLIPPSWNKGASIASLETLWSTAVQSISCANRLVLIGYSMPKTDLHFKYLLSAGLANNHSLRSFIVVNPSDLRPDLGQLLDQTYFSRRQHFLQRWSNDQQEWNGLRFEQFISNYKDIQSDLGRGELLGP